MKRSSIRTQEKRAEAVRKFRIRKRIVRHVDPSAATCRSRAKLEKVLERWLRFFLPASFPSPFSDDHRKVIKKIERCLNQGGLFADAMPRGHGKTTICKGAVLYGLCTGLSSYAISIGATADLAQGMVDFVRQQIMENDLLHEYYPHITTYARATGGKAISALYQLRADGKSSGLRWSKDTLVLPEVLNAKKQPYQSNGSILEARGITGAIRGRWKDMKTGRVLRPDFVILDDPQTRESAESVSQCDQRERTITGDVLGLAGPRKRIAAVMPCTIIRKGDLADRFLDHKKHPEWQGETCALVHVWPKAQDTLWKQYGDIYREETSEGRGFSAATEFYKAHREDMDEGAEVSWEHRVRDGEISALQTAENLLLEMGLQFWAECQNEPRSSVGSQYELTADMVIRHYLRGCPRLHLPPFAQTFVGFVDVNRSGLHWCTAGFGQDMTAHCPAYGRWPQEGELWPKDASELARKQSIYRGLKALCDGIAEIKFMRSEQAAKLGLLLIDRGYEPDVVHKFCAGAAYPFRVLPSRGYAAHKYWVKKATLVGRPLEGCHLVRSDSGQFLSFNADLWRETAQRSCLGEPGEPGGFTLYEPGKHIDRYHLAFAEQVVAEKLINKYDTEMGPRWEWVQVPGSCWDWGDAMTGCFVAAAGCGLSASGIQTPPPRRAVRKAGGITVISL